MCVFVCARTCVLDFSPKDAAAAAAASRRPRAGAFSSLFFQRMRVALKHLWLFAFHVWAHMFLSNRNAALYYPQLSSDQGCVPRTSERAKEGGTEGRWSEKLIGLKKRGWKEESLHETFFFFFFLKSLQQRAAMRQKLFCL